MLMKKQFYVAAVLVIGLLVLASCEVPSRNLTYGQDGYEVCVYNWSEYHSKPSPKALVCGASDTQRWAFWAWGGEDAESNALSRCEQQYPYCFVFAIDDRMTDWAQKISDNGGISEYEIQARNERDQRQQQEDEAASAAFVGGLLGVLGNRSYTPR
jgi:hypothetical protein